MVAEALVLISDQHFDELRIDLAEADRQAPAPLPRREGAQKPSIAVDNLCRHVRLDDRR
jgi:hypothetical protein